MRPSLVALLLLTSACAIKVHPVPTGDLGRYAKVSVRNMGVRALGARLYLEPFTCSDMSYFEKPPTPLQRGEVKSYYAAKGEVTTMSGWYVTGVTGGVQSCTINVSFVPTASDYLLAFDGDSTKCRVVPVEGTDLKAPMLPEDRIAIRRSSQPFLQTGSWCKDLTPEQLQQLGVKAPPPKAARAEAE